MPKSKNTWDGVETEAKLRKKRPGLNFTVCDLVREAEDLETLLDELRDIEIDAWWVLDQLDPKRGSGRDAAGRYRKGCGRPKRR